MATMEQAKKYIVKWARQGSGAEQCVSHVNIDECICTFCVHSISLKKI